MLKTACDRYGCTLFEVRLKPELPPFSPKFVLVLGGNTTLTDFLRWREDLRVKYRFSDPAGLEQLESMISQALGGYTLRHSCPGDSTSESTYPNWVQLLLREG